MPLVCDPVLRAGGGGSLGKDDVGYAMRERLLPIAAVATPNLPEARILAELPEGSIVFHCDRDDIFEAHRALGHKFCISGGVPNYLLAYGTPDEVRACC